MSAAEESDAVVPCLPEDRIDGKHKYNDNDDDVTPTQEVLKAIVPSVPPPIPPPPSNRSIISPIPSSSNMTVSATTASSSSIPTSYPSKQPMDKAAISPIPPGSGSATPVPPARTKKRKVAELKCREIRWHHKKSDGDKFVPFNGRDSLILEIAYRNKRNIPLDEQTEQLLKDNEEFMYKGIVVVLDGQYRLTEDESQIEAIYWKDDSSLVRRGTWFSSDWQPLDPSMADSIERHHLQHFMGQTIPEGLSVFSQKETSNKPQLTELHLETCEARWASVIDVSLSARRGALMRYFGFNKPQTLRRGYEKEAEWADSPAEISHLVLVVHGIGQKGYENLIALNTRQVRDGVVAAMERCYPDEKTRPMFLPVEWRSALKLDSGATDVLTLPKMSSMRETLNSTAMDIMYYQSPLYRKEIISGVVHQLNRVYSLFIKNNPSFNGPVSIFAHSLGSVISFDILTHWSPLLLYDKYVTEAIDEHLESCTDKESANTMQTFKEARETLHEKLGGGIQEVLLTKDEQLTFKVSYMFAVGSPLGVFLVMRGATSNDLLSHKTNVKRIFNIFHPYDPVAYRLEPMFSPEFKNIRPIKLFTSHDLRGRASYDELPLDVHKSYLKKLKNQKKKEAANGKPVDGRSDGGEQDELEEEDEADSDEFDARSGCSSPRSLTPPLPNDQEKPAKKGWFSSFSSSAPKKQVVPEVPVEVAKEAESELPLADRILGGAPRPPSRMDFQLQPALTDKSYWSVLNSHFSYWTNKDLALFVANTLYSQPPSKSTEEEKIEKPT